MRLSRSSAYLFPSDQEPEWTSEDSKDCLGSNAATRQNNLFRIYEFPRTYATLPNAGGVAAEWVTQMLR